MRIAVIGPVGAGKSTLARALAVRHGLPLVVLDDERWRSGPPLGDDDWARRHTELVRAPDWVMDGDHRAVADERFAVADVVVWLDVPRPVCARRVVARHRRSRGGIGLRDQLRWVWRYRRHGRPQTERALAGAAIVNAGLLVHRVRSPAAVPA